MRLESGARKVRPRRAASGSASDLVSRLDLKVGSQVKFGEKSFLIDGVIAEEPDRLGEGFALGPVAIIGLSDLPATQLIQPGSLYESKYRVRLPGSANPEAVGKALTAEFPDAGWDITDSSNGAPGTRRFIERMGQFLSLVGLAALVIAGIGVGNGVASYLAGKRPGLAAAEGARRRQRHRGAYLRAADPRGRGSIDYRRPDRRRARARDHRRDCGRRPARQTGRCHLPAAACCQRRLRPAHCHRLRPAPAGGDSARPRSRTLPRYSQRRRADRPADGRRGRGGARRDHRARGSAPRASRCSRSGSSGRRSGCCSSSSGSAGWCAAPRAACRAPSAPLPSSAREPAPPRCRHGRARRRARAGPDTVR